MVLDIDLDLDQTFVENAVLAILVGIIMSLIFRGNGGIPSTRVL